MSALGASVRQLLTNSNSAPTPEYIGGDGNNANPYAAASAINNLSGVTITNANLTASEIPDLSGSYLSLGGGMLTGALINSSTATSSFAGGLGIGTTSPSDVLAVNGPIYLANVSPAATTNRLYSNGGSLYWNGSLVGGGSVGNWTTDGTNVWRTGGNVGIGTASPSYALDVSGAGHFTSFADAAYFVATSSSVTSLLNGNLTVNGATTLANGTSTNFAVTNLLSATHLNLGSSFSYSGSSPSPTNTFLYDVGSVYGTPTNTNGATSLNYISENEGMTLNSGTWLEGLRVNLNSGGPSMTQGRVGITGQFQLTAPPSPSDPGSDYVGVSGSAIGEANAGGTDTTFFDSKGGLFGSNSYARLTSAGTFWGLLDFEEFDVQAPTGSSVATKWGISIVQTDGDTVQGTYDDAAIEIGNQDTATAGWKDGLLFGAAAGRWPFTASSTLIGAEARVLGPATGSPIALNGVDFRAVAFQPGGYAFASNGFTVNLSGNITSADLIATGTLAVTGTSYFAGNIGIGTTSPYALLSLAGTSNGTKPLFVISTSTANATSTALIIDQNGNLELGTASPASKFQIVGDGVGDDGVITAKDGGAILMGSNTVGYPLQIGNNTGGANSTRFRIGVNGAIDYNNNGGATPTITLPSADYLALSGGNGMTVAGNVGIGTTTPGSLLSLANIANFTTATSTFYSTGGINLGAGCFAIAGNCLGLSNFLGMLSTSQGGTGTTTWLTNSIPYYNGTTFTENNANFNFNGTSFTTPLLAASQGSGTSTIASGQGFTIGGSQFVVQQGSGNIGIGTTSPYALLSLAGTSNGTKPLFVISTSTANATSTALIIDQNGNLGLGTASPASKFQIVGDGVGDDGVITAKDGGAILMGSNTVGYPLQIGNNTGGANSTRFRIGVNGAIDYNNNGGATPTITLPSADYLALSGGNGMTVAGNVGIGTTTPGSLLSLANIANFTTATSTFYSTGGINLGAGCFAIAGNCLGLSNFLGMLSTSQGGTGTTTWLTNSIPYYNGTTFTENNANFNFNGTSFTTPLLAASQARALLLSLPAKASPSVVPSSSCSKAAATSASVPHLHMPFCRLQVHPMERNLSS